MISHKLDCTPVSELAAVSERSPLDHAPVLTPPLLTRMQRLNLEYLQLLLEVQLSGPCAHAQSLPASILQSLRKLSQPALHSMAAAPYALYTLGFEDQQFWLAALGALAPGSDLQSSNAHAPGVDGPTARIAEEASTVGDSGCRLLRHAAFSEVVIFFAWHMSVANPLAARVMCGLPPAVSACLQTASFGKLQSVMRTCPWVLMPRWPSHLRFWPDLVKSAASGDVPALRQTLLLGNQLMACELRLAESPPPELVGRLRAARSAQVQRWRMHSHK